MIPGFQVDQFPHENISHQLYTRGTGPGVVLIHELPGLTQECIRLANILVDAGYRVYMSLLFVKYNKSVPLKSLSTPSDRDKEGAAMDSLFFELEAVTADKKNLAGYKDAGIDRRGNDETIVELENRQDLFSPRSLLEDIFRRADTDENELLDIQELAKWIHAKITEHITRAMRENVGLFTAIDNNPRNGM